MQTAARLLPCPAKSLCRGFSSSNPIPLLSWFSDLPTATSVEAGLLHLHNACGHWTFEVLACTAAARLLLSTPNMTYCRKIFTTYAMKMHPHNEQKRKYKEQVARQLVSGSLPPLMGQHMRSQKLQQFKSQNERLIEKHNMHPGKGLVMMALEAGFWISYAIAYRNIVAGYPPGVADAAQMDMASQGVMWFSDLTCPDPYYILPALASSVFLFSVRLMVQWRHQNRIPELLIFKLLRYASFPLSGWMMYCLSQWPSVISLYMVTSLSIGACQAYAFTHPAVQKLLRIPQLEGHSPQPVSFYLWLENVGLLRRSPRQKM